MLVIKMKKNAAAVAAEREHAADSDDAAGAAAADDMPEFRVADAVECQLCASGLQTVKLKQKVRCHGSSSHSKSGDTISVGRV